MPPSEPPPCPRKAATMGAVFPPGRTLLNLTIAALLFDRILTAAQPMAGQ